MTCDHGVDQSFCGVCRYLPRGSDPVLETKRFFAVEEVQCAACLEPIRVGEEARQLDVGWVEHASHVRSPNA